MEYEGDHFLAYYLTKEDEAAGEFKRARMARPVNAEQEEDEEVLLRYISSYGSLTVMTGYTVPLHTRL